MLTKLTLTANKTANIAHSHGSAREF